VTAQASIEVLAAAGFLSPLDVHFARALGRIGGEIRAEVLLGAALASREIGQGNVCLDLRTRAASPAIDESGQVLAGDWPESEAWIAALRSSPCVSRADGSEPRPLVLDGAGRLYLHRYWSYQQRLADGIRARVDVSSGSDGAEPSVPREMLHALFDSPGAKKPDWQRIAALAALRGRFCVISGGPGTGKTYTVVKILALLVQQAFDAGLRPPRIQLVAPTGKAAARLRDSIRANKAGLPLSDAVRAAIPEEASTIHRCLGARPTGARRYRHDGENPLLADVVLVDEASMVDLALMARLVDALRPAARLILLGDKDQLASVEAGAVLGDICNTGGDFEHSHVFAAEVARLTGDTIELSTAAPVETGIWDSVVRLTHSYRFTDDGGIGGLARAINAGDADKALALLAAGGQLAWVEAGEEALRGDLLDLAVEGFAPYLKEGDPAAQLDLLNRFRVLCAHRRGAAGVETLNLLIEADLRRRDLLDPDGGESYRGRPLLVMRNDYQVELFNGDVGVIGELGGGAEARRVAFFATAEGTPRAVALSRLPAHETVFAMTVHKSQGSEFRHVAVVLPEEPSPVVTRALLYTAVSRARERVTLFARREVLRQAIEHRVERASGLRDALWR
jgi:exodeoxyribonuclease V alpha subunit